MVLPLSDDNSDRRTFPAVTVGLIVANVLVFVVLQRMGTNDDFTSAFSTVPAEIVSGRDIVTEGKAVQEDTMNGPVIVQMPGLRRTPGAGYFTLLTSMFLHCGIALTLYDEQRRDLATQIVGPFRGTADWREEAKVFRIPGTAREGIFRIGLFGATGTAAFDKLAMKPVENK